MSAVRLAFVLTALVVAAAGAARAETTLQTMRNAGLMATWSANCAADPSTTNWFMTFYAASSGMVRRRSNRGPSEAALENAIDRAARPTATSVFIRMRNDDPNWGNVNGRSYDIVFELVGRRLHSISSVRDDGVVLFKDGKVVSSGEPTRVIERCGN